MFRRVLLTVLCLFSVPALAANLEITEDTVIDFSTPGVDFIHVRGDATLTVRGTLDVRVVSSIKLFDTASLVLEGGRIEKSIWFLGSDNQADFVGGRFSSMFWGGGSGLIVVDGTTELGATLDFSGGKQDVVYKSFLRYGAGNRVTSPSTFVTAYSRFPGYGSGVNGAKLTGISADGVNTTSVTLGPNVDWLMYPADNRPFGDTNGDFKVDVADLNNVRNYFGDPEDAWPGDTFPMDGKVDIKDLNLIRNTFGESSIATATPEPSTMALALAALAGILGRCRWWQSLRRCI